MRKTALFGSLLLLATAGCSGPRLRVQKLPETRSVHLQAGPLVVSLATKIHLEARLSGLDLPAEEDVWIAVRSLYHGFGSISFIADSEPHVYSRARFHEDVAYMPLSDLRRIGRANEVLFQVDENDPTRFTSGSLQILRKFTHTLSYHYDALALELERERLPEPPVTTGPALPADQRLPAPETPSIGSPAPR